MKIKLLKGGNNTRMELKWKDAIKIPDGTHKGKITKIIYKTEPFEYTDIFIKLDEFDLEIKYGCPTVLSDNSKLGRLLKVFGVEAIVGIIIDPEKVLVGQKVMFMTILKKTKDGNEYAEIVIDSIKPINPLD